MKMTEDESQFQTYPVQAIMADSHGISQATSKALPVLYITICTRGMRLDLFKSITLKALNSPCHSTLPQQ